MDVFLDLDRYRINLLFASEFTLLIIGIEGYFLYHSITRVFKTGTLYVFIYFIGYGVPLALVLSLFTISRFLGMDSYVRFYGDDETPVCWLHEDFMWVFLAYVGMVLAFNIAVTARAVGAAYQSAGFRFEWFETFVTFYILFLGMWSNHKDS